MLPKLEDFRFSTYTISNDDHINNLRDLYSKSIFKAYDCQLCPLEESDNVIIVSNAQNNLFINENTPSMVLREKFRGNVYDKGEFFNIPHTYTISGTTPQYYYNHLLLSTEQHVTSYGIFIDKRIFMDIMLFLKENYEINRKYIVAFFNGNSGSDVHHSHVHLTDDVPKKVMSVCKDIIRTNKINTKTIVTKPYLLVYSSNSLDELFINVSNDFIALIESGKLSDNSGYRTSATLMFYNNLYFVIVSFVTNSYISRSTKDGSNFKLIPSSFLFDNG